MKTTFYSPEELAKLGLRHCGDDVKISRLASIFQPELLSIGSHSRIDDFCVLSGAITIGRNVHLGAFGALHGACGITLGDFASVAGRVSIYTVSDDYVFGSGLMNPTVPEAFRNHVSQAPVVLGKHSALGCGTVVLPGSTLGLGTTVGALALVNGELADWTLYMGNPARKVGIRRSQHILQLESQYLASETNDR